MNILNLNQFPSRGFKMGLFGQELRKPGKETDREIEKDGYKE